MVDLASNLASRDPKSRAEMDFDTDRPLDLSRSIYTDHDRRVYIYSPAVDGLNPLRVATVEIANVAGLNDTQVEFLTNKVADAIVNGPWKSIENAPRDGTTFLATGLDWGFGHTRHRALARWHAKKDCFIDVRNPKSELRYLTHWLDEDSLPDPTTEKGRG